MKIVETGYYHIPTFTGNNAPKSVNIKYTKSYSTAPMVILSPAWSGYEMLNTLYTAGNRNADGFTLYYTALSEKTGGGDLRWFAILD